MKGLAALPGEPVKWFSRFLAYVELGPNRTIEEVWTSEASGSKGKRPGRQWYEMSQKWEWKKRAESFDLSELEKESAEIQTTFRRERNKRLKIIKRATTKLFRAMAGLPPVIATWGEFSGALRVVMQVSQDELALNSLELTIEELSKQVNSR